MIEHPVRVQIALPQAVMKPRLGGHFDLVAGPTPLGNPNNTESATVYGWAFLWLQPHEGPVGNYWWLVSVLPTVNGVRMSEDRCKSEILNVEGDHSGEAVPLGRVRAGFWWRRGGRCKLTKVMWGKKVMEKLWEREGDPEGEGLPMAQRLLPRLVGGALRDMEPETVIQLWVKL